MNDFRENRNKESSTQTRASLPPPTTEDSPVRAVRTTLPAGWRRLASGMRDVRLYLVKPRFGGVYWVTEMELNGQPLRRRFATELHARAWITLAKDPHPTELPLDLEELRESIRATGYGRGR